MTETTTPLIHQWNIEVHRADLPLCGAVQTEAGLEGYFSVPSVVTCPACLVKLADGYLEVVRKSYPKTAGLTPEQLEIVAKHKLEEIAAAPIDPSAYPAMPTPESRPRPPLSPRDLMLIGIEFPATRPPQEAIEEHLNEQRTAYASYSKDQLIEELISRDRNQIIKGQEIAEGKTAGKLLREFVRGILYQADVVERAAIHRELASKSPSPIEGILKLLGAEPASRRDLKLNGGTTLGNINETPADDPTQLPDWQRSQPRADVAQSIRDNQARTVDANPAPMQKAQTDETRGDE